jgi:hypothetical protein
MSFHPTKRITPGLYEFTYKGRTFQVEDLAQFVDAPLFKSDWQAYEITAHGNRVWLNDFMTKRAAIHQTIVAVDMGY